MSTARRAQAGSTADDRRRGACRSLERARAHPARVEMVAAKAADVDRPEIVGGLAFGDPLGERHAGAAGTGDAHRVEAGADEEVRRGENAFTGRQNGIAIAGEPASPTTNTSAAAGAGAVLLGPRAASASRLRGSRAAYGS